MQPFAQQAGNARQFLAAVQRSRLGQRQHGDVVGHRFQDSQLLSLAGSATIKVLWNPLSKELPSREPLHAMTTRARQIQPVIASLRTLKTCIAGRYIKRQYVQRRATAPSGVDLRICIIVQAFRWRTRPGWDG